MSELMKLIEMEIPEGRQNLQDNFSNLEKVAQYCQENYVQVKSQRNSDGLVIKFCQLSTLKQQA